MLGLISSSHDSCPFLFPTRSWGKVYMFKAIELYADWGAMAKVSKMRQQYAEYLEGSTISEARRGSAINSRTRLGDLSIDTYKDLRTESTIEF